MPEEKKANALALTTQFPALDKHEVLAEVVAANFSGGTTASWADLERIKVGSGGAPCFVTEDEIDGAGVIEDFEAIVCWYRDGRSWWMYPIDWKGEVEGGRSTFPACSSDDGVHADGDNGFGAVDCNACPNNRFGKRPGPDIEGNFCRAHRTIFLLREGRDEVLFPSVLVAPPTSLKPISKYMTALATRGIPFYACVHRFTLVEAQNSEGTKYSKIKLEKVRKITDEEVKKVRAFAEAVQPAFESLNVTADIL